MSYEYSKKLLLYFCMDDAVYINFFFFYLFLERETIFVIVMH